MNSRMGESYSRATYGSTMRPPRAGGRHEVAWKRRLRSDGRNFCGTLAFSPRLLEEIAPWIQRLKSLRTDIALAVIAPILSPRAQAFCVQNAIDFVDLARNIFINVPGKFTLQRSGMKGREITPSSLNSQRNINVFSGRSSRILRVLLQ